MNSEIYIKFQEILKLTRRFDELSFLLHTLPYDHKQFDSFFREKASINKRLEELNYQPNTDNMTMVNILVFMYTHPSVKVTHRLFEPNEYIYYDEEKDCILDEHGYVFEDWQDDSYNGMINRGRNPEWNIDWTVYPED